MSASEIKSEIQKALDSVPESVLQEVLALLNQAQKQSSQEWDLTKNLQKVIDEDYDLLQQLAK